MNVIEVIDPNVIVIDWIFENVIVIVIDWKFENVIVIVIDCL